MYTSVLFVGVTLANWEMVEAFLYDPIRNGQLSIHHHQLDSSSPERSFQHTLKNLADDLRRIHCPSHPWRALFVLDTGLAKIDPIEFSLVAQIKRIRSMIRTQLVQGPNEIFYLFLDSVERNENGEPKDIRERIAWELERFGYLESDQHEEVFSQEDFRPLDEKWEELRQLYKLTDTVWDISDRDYYQKLNELVAAIGMTFDTVINGIAQKRADNITDLELTEIKQFFHIVEPITKDDPRIKDYFIQQYQIIKTEFEKEIRNSYRENYNLPQPSLKVKAILKAMHSLQSYQNDWMFRLVMDCKDSRYHIRSTFMSALLIRFLATHKLSESIRSGRVYQCLTECHSEKLQLVLQQYQAGLKELKRQKMIESEPRKVTMRDYEKEIAASLIKHDIAEIQKNLGQSRLRQKFNPAAFFRREDEDAWESYIFDIERKLQDYDARLEQQMADFLRTIHKLEIQQTNIDEKVLDSRELLESTQQIERELKKVEERLRTANLKQYGATEGFQKKLPKINHTMRKMLTSRLSYSAFWISIIVWALILLINYPLLIRPQLTQDFQWFIIASVYLGMLVLGTAIGMFLVYMARQRIIAVANYLRNTASQEMKSALDSLDKFKTYIECIQKSKVLRRSRDEYQQKLDKLNCQASKISTHHFFVDQHIAYCQGLLSAYHLEKLVNELEKPVLFHHPLDWETGFIQNRYYSPFYYTQDIVGLNQLTVSYDGVNRLETGDGIALFSKLSIEQDKVYMG